jgi:aminoglycoside phosphotransferase (APT) family kinase protein
VEPLTWLEQRAKVTARSLERRANHWEVDAGPRKLVLRQCRRPSEGRNAQIASEKGWGPEWVAGDESAFLVHFIDGAAPLSSEGDFRAAEALLAEVHRSGAAFPARVSAEEALELSWHRARARNNPCLVTREWEIASGFEKARELRRTAPIVAIHGDPHPANFVSAAGRVWLLDWEYAGLGDADWDLGYWAATSGRPAPSARAEAYRSLALLVWELWG